VDSKPSVVAHPALAAHGVRSTSLKVELLRPISHSLNDDGHAGLLRPTALCGRLAAANEASPFVARVKIDASNTGEAPSTPTEQTTQHLNAGDADAPIDPPMQWRGPWVVVCAVARASPSGNGANPPTFQRSRAVRACGSNGCTATAPG